MSCCGKKRNNMAQSSAQGMAKGILRRLSSPMASVNSLGIQFEYRGGGVLYRHRPGNGASVSLHRIRRPAQCRPAGPPFAEGNSATSRIRRADLKAHRDPSQSQLGG